MLQPPEHCIEADSHEHPAPFSPLPLVDERALESISTVIEAASKPDEAAAGVLQRIRAWLNAFDMVVVIGRAFAEHGQLPPNLMDAALSELAQATGRLPSPSVHASDPDVQTTTPTGSYLFSRAPLADLVLGLTYQCGGDTGELARKLAELREGVARLAPLIDAAEGMAATNVPHAGVRVRLIGLALTGLVRMRTARADGFVTSVDELIDAWLEHDPIASLIHDLEGDALTERIGRIDPARAYWGDAVTIVPRPGATFEADGTGMRVVSADGTTELPVLSWSPDAVKVHVSPGVVSGPVVFAGGGKVSANEGLEHVRQLLGGEWGATALGALERAGLRRPMWYTGMNQLDVFAVPDFAARLVGSGDRPIDSFSDLDPDDGELAVTWNTASIPPRATVTLVITEKTVATVDAASGRLALPAEVGAAEALFSGTLRLEVIRFDDGRAEAPQGRPWMIVEKPVLPPELLRHQVLPLSFNPPRLKRVVPSHQQTRSATAQPGYAHVIVRFPLPAPEGGMLQVSSSAPERVTVEAPLPVSRSDRQALIFVNVWAYHRDRPGFPAAAISVRFETARFTYEGNFEVWVAPLEGKWELVGGVRSPRVEPSDDQAGRIPGERLDTIAIHAIQLETGNTLFFSPPQAPNDPNNQRGVEAELWDPNRRRRIERDEPPDDGSPRNLFCAGHCHLPDGRVLVAGGHSPTTPGQPTTDRSIHIYNPREGRGRRWRRLSQQMSDGRWYPTCTLMPDGRALIVSGSGVGAWAPIVEPSGRVVSFVGWSGDTARFTDAIPLVGLLGRLGGGSATSIDLFDPRTNSLLRFPDANFLDTFHDTYPFMALLPNGPGYPNGAVLVIERSNLLFFPYEPGGGRSPLGTPTRRRLATRFRRTYPTYGCGVLLPVWADDPNRIRYLVAGGGGVENASLSTRASATDTAEIIDFNPNLPLPNQAEPSMRRVRRMRSARFMSDAVLLANGNVLICGGARTGVVNRNSDPVTQAEIFDSISETFQPADAATVDRRYHATHLLLPDGSVQATGSTGGFPSTPGDQRKRVEIYRPAYMWFPRPRITAVPRSIGYGTTFTIGCAFADQSHRVALVRLSSVTHSNNMDQRYVVLQTVPLTRMQGGATVYEVRVTAPRHGSIAPPGPYYLVLVDGSNVPSLASQVFLRS